MRPIYPYRADQPLSMTDSRSARHTRAGNECVDCLCTCISQCNTICRRSQRVGLRAGARFAVTLTQQALSIALKLYGFRNQIQAATGIVVERLSENQEGAVDGRRAIRAPTRVSSISAPGSRRIGCNCDF